MEEGSPINERQKLFIGVDGGGSKTRFFLSDIEANAYKVVETPGTNKNSVGDDVARTNLQDGFSQLREHPQFTDELLAGVCVGMAGVSAPADKLLVQSWIRESFPNAPPTIQITVQSDAIIGLAAGTNGVQHGIVLISGTGMIALGMKPDQEPVQAGGWGPLFGDIGSGYWIGTEIMRAVARARDGFGATVLDRLIQEKIGERADLLRWAYRSSEQKSDDGTWKKFADLAPLLFLALKENDAVAQDLLNRSADGLVEVVIRVLQLLKSESEPITLVLVGGLLTHEGSPLAEGIRQRLAAKHPQVQVTLPSIPPERAATLLAINAYKSSDNYHSD